MIHRLNLDSLLSSHPKLFTFRGHSKAVSYVRFLSSTELVSASTDSTLKLWDVEQKVCKRTFQGHVNDKNFVGLTHSGDYIACGSENNALFVYYKGMSRPIVTHYFGSREFAVVER